MQKKYRWRCAKGHEWDAKATHIKTSNSWCPICSGRIIIAPLLKLQSLAEQQGGKCLSKEYINSKTKLLWKCAKGHEWQAAPSSIKSGQWCPICAVKIQTETRRKKT
jgi:tRNA(Arg) A34 adenosine deaminase TadA